MFSRTLKICYFFLLATSFSCQQITPLFQIFQNNKNVNLDEKRDETDFRLRVNVYNEKISISLTNISGHDMLLETRYPKLNYLIQYETSNGIKELLEIDMLEEIYYPFSIFCILNSQNKDENWIAHNVFYTFTISKPDDLIQLKSAQVDFRALPLSKISNVKTSFDLAKQLRFYQLTYLIPDEE